MSGGSRSSYRSSYRPSTDLWSDDTAAKRRAEAARARRLESVRSKAVTGKAPPPPKREAAKLYDRNAVRDRITRPAKSAKRVHVVLVDNSGSNKVIAKHLRDTSGYLLGLLETLDPESQVAFIYFSDHCDGHLIRQDVDYVSPDDEGDKTLLSTVSHVRPAVGGDEPEAIECTLWEACDLDFGHVQERHLYLVTDVVAHGMGMGGDDGCPEQRDWRKSLERVRETYTSFEVIGCGRDQRTGRLQRQFLAPDRLGYDLIDLSAIPSHEHRTGITGNALLFLIARRRGLQAVEAFLMTLYEKWLSEPIFGANTDLGAREAIARFGKYIEASQPEIDKLMARIFGD